MIWPEPLFCCTSTSTGLHSVHDRDAQTARASGPAAPVVVSLSKRLARSRHVQLVIFPGLRSGFVQGDSVRVPKSATAYGLNLPGSVHTLRRTLQYLPVAPERGVGARQATRLLTQQQRRQVSYGCSLKAATCLEPGCTRRQLLPGKGGRQHLPAKAIQLEQTWRSFSWRSKTRCSR